MCRRDLWRVVGVADGVALRLGLTDPRFPLAAIPGAVTAQSAGRQALTRAMARENSAILVGSFLLTLTCTNS